MRKNSNHQIISLKLNKDLYAQVKDHSKTSGTDSVSAVVRQAIVFYLSANTTKNNQA